MLDLLEVLCLVAQGTNVMGLLAEVAEMGEKKREQQEEEEG
jgi:hypothetical protein